jgi:hypothetical protein
MTAVRVLPADVAALRATDLIRAIVANANHRWS